MATILVVENEPVISADLCETLARLGYSVLPPVSTGQAAIDAARFARPDLVLMDIGLDGAMDGVEAARTICAERETPVVFLTSFADDATLSRASGALPYGYLIKPAEERGLRAAVEVALKKHQAQLDSASAGRFYAQALRSIAEAAVVLTSEGRVLFVNDRASALVGLSQQTSAGRDLGEVLYLVEPGTSSRVDLFADSSWNHPERAGEPVALELLGPRGRRLLLDVSLSPLIGDDGGPLGALLLLHDAAARLRDEGRLSALGAQAAFAAHEINNPLTVVSLTLSRAQKWLKLVQARGEGPLEVERALERAGEIERALGQASASAARIARSAAALRRLGEARGAHPGFWPLPPLLDAAVSLTTRGAAPPVERDYRGAPSFCGDAAELLALLIDLLQHARARSEAQGGASLGLSLHELAGGGAVIEVSDGASPPDGDELARALERDLPAAPGADGPMFGLGACQRAAMALGGELELLAASGRGRLLRLSLPAPAASADEERGAGDSTREPGEGARASGALTSA